MEPSRSTHLGELPLVQAHTNRVHLLHRPVEVRLEVPMSSQGLGDMTGTPKLGVQLDRLEIVDVVPVKEHVSERGRLLVDLDGVAGEDDALGDDPGGVGGEEGAHGDEAGD